MILSISSMIFEGKIWTAENPAYGIDRAKADEMKMMAIKNDKR
jgi:hypothetical protein